MAVILYNHINVWGKEWAGKTRSCQMGDKPNHSQSAGARLGADSGANVPSWKQLHLVTWVPLATLFTSLYLNFFICKIVPESSYKLNWEEILLVFSGPKKYNLLLFHQPSYSQILLLFHRCLLFPAMLQWTFKTNALWLELKWPFLPIVVINIYLYHGSLDILVWVFNSEYLGLMNVVSVFTDLLHYAISNLYFFSHLITWHYSNIPR